MDKLTNKTMETDTTIVSEYSPESYMASQLVSVSPGTVYCRSVQIGPTDLHSSPNVLSPPATNSCMTSMSPARQERSGITLTSQSNTVTVFEDPWQAQIMYFKYPCSFRVLFLTRLCMMTMTRTRRCMMWTMVRFFHKYNLLSFITMYLDQSLL